MGDQLRVPSSLVRTSLEELMKLPPSSFEAVFSVRQDHREVPEGFFAELRKMRFHEQEEGIDLEKVGLMEGRTIVYGDDFRFSREGHYTYGIYFYFMAQDNAVRIGAYETKFYILYGHTLEVGAPKGLSFQHVPFHIVIGGKGYLGAIRLCLKLY